jgi:hypothetical protein
MYSNNPPPGRVEVAARYPCCPHLRVDPQASMSSRQSVRESLKPPEQSDLLVHVSTK